MRRLIIPIMLTALSACTSVNLRPSIQEPQRAPASAWQADGQPDQTLPKSESPLFSKSEPIKLFLRADFNRIHLSNAGGNWTGEDQDDKTIGKDPITWDINGQIGEADKPTRSIQADVRARGMSSAQEGEAQFPKLRVEIRDEEDLKNTVFKGARNFRINTHVSTNPKKEYTKMGRLNNEKSPYREATAYEIGNVLGLPSPSFRRASIQYTDTGKKQSFERKALIIETDKKIAERFQAKVSERFPSNEPQDQVSTQLAARFHLFNILIGNEDVGLKIKNESASGTEKYRPLFNTTVFELPDGQLFPVIYDFDLSSIVAGWGMIKYSMYKNPALGIEDGRIGRFAIGLAYLRSRLNKQEYQLALSQFSSREANILNVIKNATVDDEFKKHAVEHVQLFKQTVSLLNQLPMLKKKSVQLFADPALSKPLLRPDQVEETPGTLRPGTPIKVIKKSPKVVQIAILDFK